jgi:hypothetical protein
VQPRYITSSRLEVFRYHASLCVPEEHLRFPFDVRNVNIVDPITPWNNLGKSVTRKGLSALVGGLAAGRARVRSMLRNCFRLKRRLETTSPTPRDVESAMAEVAAQFDSFFLR